MDQGYRWQFSEPGQQLTVHMVNTEAGKTFLMRRWYSNGRR